MENQIQNNLTIDQNTNVPLYEATESIEENQRAVKDNDAFYATALMPSEDPIEMYDNLLENIYSVGDSEVVQALRSEYIQSKNLEQAGYVESLIADTTLDRNTKRKLLSNSLNYNKDRGTLRSAYLETMSMQEMAEQDYSDQEIEHMTLRLHAIKTEEDFNAMLKDVTGMIRGDIPLPNVSQQEIDQLKDPKFLENFLENVWDPVIAEPAALIQTLVIGLLPYIGEIAGTGASWAYKSLTEEEKVNVSKQREIARKVIAEHGGDWLLETYQDFIGLLGIEKEDLEQAYITKGFTKLDEGLTWVAEKITPDDVDKSKIFLELLTAAAIPGLKKGSKLSKDAYLRVTDPNAYQIVKMLEKDPKLSKVAKPFLEDSKVRTIEDLGFKVPKDSPLDQTIASNKTAAKGLIESYMTDPSTRAIKATKYELSDFISAFMVPAIVRKPFTSEYYDATSAFKALKIEQERAAYDFVINEHLVDQNSRKVWLEENMNVVNDSLLDTKIDFAPSKSKLLVDETGINMQAVFDDGGFNYRSYADAVEAANLLKEKVRNLAEDPGEIFVEALDHRGDVIGVLETGKLADFVADPTNPAVGSTNFRVKWQRKGTHFDEVRQASEGFGQKPYRDVSFFGMKKAEAALSRFFTGLFENPLWNSIAAFGRSGKQLEQISTMSHMRAERLVKSQLEILGKNLKLTNKEFRHDLKKLYDEMQDRSDLFTLDEIFTVLDRNVEASHARDLQSALFLTRQIERFNYNLLNNYEINRYVKQGFNNFLDLRDVDGNLSRRMVQQEFQFPFDKDTGALKPVNKVWDTQRGEAIDFVPHKANDSKVAIKQFIYENDKPTKQIIKLAEDFVDSSGRRYEYATVPTGIKFKGTPDWIVPTRTGHLPKLSEGTFFIKVVPKFVERNGIRMPGNESYSKTIAMFKTETEAKRWLEANEGKLPELDASKYDWATKKAEELAPSDNLQANILRASREVRSGKARSEKMYNGIYADPLESFILSTQRLGTDAYMQPVIDQMKIAWYEHYKDKVNFIERQGEGPGEFTATKTNGPLDRFPTNKASFTEKAGRSADYKQALVEWERLAVMQQGHGGQLGAKYLSMLGNVIGEVTDAPATLYLSKLARKLERNPEMVIDYPKRVVTTFKITLAAIWRNLTLQPIGIFGPMLVANPQEFMTTLRNAAASVHYRVMQNDTFGKYSKYNEAIHKFGYEQNNVLKLNSKEGILSTQDHAFINDYWQKSGYGVIGDHILSKGLFSASVETLGSTSTFSRYASRALQGYNKIGFELGEFMNRAGMWHAAREVWMQQNPGKNWRTAQAMEMITMEAHKLAGSMTKQNTYAFQRVPILSYIGQFQAFGMKASESIWNKGASPFSPKQRAALAMYNLGVFGVRGGMIYGLGELLMDYLNASGASDIADKLDELALTRLVINNVADAIMPTYDQEGNLIQSTADIAAVYSPFGTEAGGVYRSFWKTGVVIFGGDVPGYQLSPATRTAVQAIDTYQLMSAMWQDDKTPLGEKLGKSLIQLSRLSSGGSSLWNTYMYNQLQEKISKTGQSTGVPESNFDRYSRLFSVPNDKDRELFEAWRGITDEEKKYKKMAEVWWQSQLVLHGTQMTFGEITEAFKGANNLMELTENQKDFFWEHLITLDNRRVNSRLDSFFNDILARRRIHANPKYSPEEIRAMRAFVKQAGNTELARNIKPIVDQLEQIKED